MTKMKLIKGDKVLVIAGKDKGKTGTIERVIPSKNKVVVGGINVTKKHMKKSQKHPQGGIVDLTMPIHISNVMLLDPSKNKPTRIGYKLQGKSKERVAKVSGEVVSGAK